MVGQINGLSVLDYPGYPDLIGEQLVLPVWLILVMANWSILNEKQN